MENIFKYIKECTYDFVGYVVPGIIVFYLLLIVATQEASPIYILFTNRQVCKSVLENLVSINIFAIIVISYLLGHGVNFIWNMIEKISRLFLKNENNKKLEYKLKQVVLELYSEDDILISLDEEEGNRYLLTLASTNSRFENHNDLIQKYIYKKKLYGSLSCICLGLLIDGLLSIIPIVIDTKLSEKFCFILLILVFLVIMMISFYSEYKKHLNLRRKESYMYLINKEKDKEISSEKNC